MTRWSHNTWINLARVEFRPRCPYPTTPTLWQEEQVAMSCAEEANMQNNGKNIHLLDITNQQTHPCFWPYFLSDRPQSLMVAVYCSTHRIISHPSGAVCLSAVAQWPTQDNRNCGQAQYKVWLREALVNHCWFGFNLCLDPPLSM